jgi:hypothetical protein
METFVSAVSDHLLYFIIGVCVVVALVLKAITTIFSTFTRERSRREIAAYIAEGSITPEQGERLLKVDVNRESTAKC